MDYLSSFIGPKLDNLNFDMIDSGKSRSSLLAGHNSFSSSRGSNIDSLDVWSCSSPSPSKHGSTGKKRFPIRRRKKKTKEGAGSASFLLSFLPDWVPVIFILNEILSDVWALPG